LAPEGFSSLPGEGPPCVFGPGVLPGGFLKRRGQRAQLFFHICDRGAPLNMENWAGLVEGEIWQGGVGNNPGKKEFNVAMIQESFFLEERN